MESLSQADEPLPARAVTGPAQANAAKTAIATIDLRMYCSPAPACKS
jgi:hypothetical protein